MGSGREPVGLETPVVEDPDVGCGAIRGRVAPFDGGSWPFVLEWPAMRRGHRILR
jgi:hypothetical protein